MLHNSADLRRHLLPNFPNILAVIDTPDADADRTQRYDHAFADDLDVVLADLRALLIAKNAAYGDSALNPVRLFSQADPIEQLKVRIDDKVSRVRRGRNAADDEDVVGDWLGYLVLLCIAQRRAATAAASGLGEVAL